MENTYYANFWVTGDICLIEQKVEVAGVIITSSTSTKCVVSLYDGVNSNGKLLGTFRVAADTSIPFNFPQIILCNSGLYIDIDANTTGVMVFYRPIKPEG